MASSRKTHMLERRDVVARILKDRGETLVVTGLGSTTFDAAAAGDHPNNFYLWGAMGGTAMVGLGLALTQPKRRVLVITGDGDMLMGIGSLATVAVKRPANYALCVIDNQRYGETGMQDTATEHGVDLAAMAAGAGFAEARTVRDAVGLEDAVALLLAAPGAVFVDVKVAAKRPPMVLPMRDGTAIKQRFMASVLGDDAAK